MNERPSAPVPCGEHSRAQARAANELLRAALRAMNDVDEIDRDELVDLMVSARLVASEVVRIARGACRGLGRGQHWLDAILKQVTNPGERSRREALDVSLMGLARAVGVAV